MTTRVSLSCAAALAALLGVQAFVIAQGQGPAKGPGGPGPFVFDTNSGQRIKVTLVADGLVHPFGMAFPDARTILVTERAGRLRVVKDGKLLPKPAWEAPQPPAGSPPSNNAPDLLHFVELLLKTHAKTPRVFRAGPDLRTRPPVSPPNGAIVTRLHCWRPLCCIGRAVRLHPHLVAERRGVPVARVHEGVGR